jgi:MFS superfamily sulfate permease-like transporter
VLDLEGVNFVDSQGAAKLTELLELAEANGIELRLARLKPGVSNVLAADGLIDRIGPGHIHGNVHRAVEAAQAAQADRKTVASGPATFDR